MSKYNLTDILNEFIGGGRIGTLKISFKDLQDKMDDLENSGKVIVRTLPGPSGDGKVNREFEVVDRDSAVPGGNKQERGFTVYDYKFGFDPGSEEHFMEEYPFSVGGNDLRLAMELIPDVVPYRLEEEIDENRREKNPEGMGQLYVQPAVQKAVKFHLDAYDKGDIDVEDMIQAIEDIIFGYVKAPGMNEQMYIDDEEFEMEMGRSKKDSLKKEMMIHIDQLIDGNIDMNDFMNVVEDIMAEVNSMKEVMGVDRKGKKKPDSEDGMISKAKKSMKENGDVNDYLDELSEAVEVMALLDKIRKHLKGSDRNFLDKEIEAYIESLKRDIKQGEFDGVESASMEDHEEDLLNYIADRSLQEHFKRFM